MGERTVSTSRMPRWLQGTDGWLLLAVVILALWGLVMVYSTGAEVEVLRTPQGAAIDPLALFRRQAMFVAVGAALAVLLAAIDYRRWEHWAPLVLIGTWLALLAVLVLSRLSGGVGRFLLGGSFQPSEIAKVATVFYLAVWLARRGEKINDREYGLMPLGFLVGISGGLVMLEPDFSAAATIVGIGFLMFFLAGGSLRQLLLVVVAAVAGGALVVLFYPQGLSRWSGYVAGLRDPRQAAYQIRLAMAAVSRGGLLGVGPGQSQLKVSGLPLAHTDSVFAVVAEEFGLVGATVMIFLFGVVVWRGIGIALRAPDRYGRLLAGGLALWLGLEAFANMAMIVNVLPLGGNTLPLISYGGSSLVTTLVAVGLLQSVARASARTQQAERSDTGAVVSLRGRDRRRRVSRAVRSASVRR